MLGAERHGSPGSPWAPFLIARRTLLLSPEKKGVERRRRRRAGTRQGEEEGEGGRRASPPFPFSLANVYFRPAAPGLRQIPRGRSHNAAPSRQGPPALCLSPGSFAWRPLQQGRGSPNLHSQSLKRLEEPLTTALHSRAPRREDSPTRCGGGEWAPIDECCQRPLASAFPPPSSPARSGSRLEGFLSFTVPAPVGDT